MTRARLLLLPLALGVAPAAPLPAAEPPDVLALVDPFVGTGAHGHTYPGATVPFRMVQVSPDTHTSGWSQDQERQPQRAGWRIGRKTPWSWTPGI